MNGDAFSIKAPKECSKKFAATFKGKLLKGNFLRIFFFFLEDFGAPLWKRCRHSSYSDNGNGLFPVLDRPFSDLHRPFLEFARMGCFPSSKLSELQTHPNLHRPVGVGSKGSGQAQGEGTKVTEKAQNADFRRKPQIFADSLLLEIPAFGGRRKPQKTADFAENRRFSQKTAGNRRLGSVTLGPSPLAQP